MPVPATVPEFIDMVRKSGLVDDARLQAELSKRPGDTPDALAVALVRGGLLTKFQARQLKLGRYKRFMIANKYRLLELIGVGGMGAVYLCEHVFMRRLVALKVLPLEKLSDPSNLERFYREARAVAALDDPNIVRAYDIDKADGLHFLVMEYVDGTSLQEIVARHGPLDPHRAAGYIAQAALGMQHGHELGMVHRDIKPGNLLLDRTGTVKLLDMGLARFFHDKTDQLTAKYDDNCVLGTADYLAPEQALSNEVDIRADIYALGGTLYFLLTGQSPVPEGTVAYKLMFHQTEEPKPVTGYRSDVPAELLAVLHTMMRKRPDERYPLPRDVAAALAPWADPPPAPPPHHEMPDHCPAVVAAAGYAERGRSIISSTRSTVRPGLPRAGGGSSVRMASAAVASLPAVDDGGTGSVRVGQPSAQAQVPTGGRSSSTLPIGPKSDPPPVGSLVEFGPDGPSDVGTFPTTPLRRPADRRRWVWAAAVGGLAVSVGVLAAVLTSGGKPKPDPTAPAPAEPAVSADHAARFVGQERTVEFVVRRVDEAADGLVLHSRADEHHPDDFAAVLPARAVAAAGTTPEQVRDRYLSRPVRVRGRIDLTGTGYQIEVESLSQLTAAGRN